MAAHLEKSQFIIVRLWRGAGNANGIQE